MTIHFMAFSVPVYFSVLPIDFMTVHFAIHLFRNRAFEFQEKIIITMKSTTCFKYITYGFFLSSQTIYQGSVRVSNRSFAQVS